ncbi:MAG: DUF4199 domain-containing protein, partial [Leeuwenhoekiella sp.]
MPKFILPIRFGLAIAGSLIVYFLLLSIFNLHINPLFSLFNGAITGFGIYEAIKYYKREKGASFEYSDGFSVGVVTGFVATILFTIFFGLYAGNFNQDFLDNIINKWEDTYNTSLGSMIFLVAIFGFATSLV